MFINPIIKRLIQNIKDEPNNWEFQNSCFINKARVMEIDTYNKRLNFYSLKIKRKTIFLEEDINYLSQFFLMRVIHKLHNKQEKIKQNSITNEYLNYIPIKEENPEEFI